MMPLTGYSSSSPTLRLDVWFKIQFSNVLLTAMDNSTGSSSGEKGGNVPLMILNETVPRTDYASQNFQFSATDLGQVGTQLYTIRNNATGADYYLGLADDRRTAVMKRFDDGDASLLWSLSADRDLGWESAGMQNYALGPRQQLYWQGEFSKPGAVGMGDAKPPPPPPSSPPDPQTTTTPARNRFNITSSPDTITPGALPSARPPANFVGLDPLRAAVPSSPTSSSPSSTPTPSLGSSSADGGNTGSKTGPSGATVAAALIGALLAIALLAGLAFCLWRRKAKRDKMRELNGIDFLGSHTALTRSGRSSTANSSRQVSLTGPSPAFSSSGGPSGLPQPAVAQRLLQQREEQLAGAILQQKRQKEERREREKKRRSEKDGDDDSQRAATEAERAPLHHRRLDEISIASASISVSVSGVEPDDVSSIGSAVPSPRRSHNGHARWPSIGESDPVSPLR